MLPRVVLHNAVTVNGRTDPARPDLALFYGLLGRFEEDATLAGCDTLLLTRDEIPPETEEDRVAPPPDPDDRRPLLAVVDSRGRLKTWHYWRSLGYWRRMVALCSEATPAEHREYLADRGVDRIVAGRERVDLRAALEALARDHGVRTVRLESGGALSTALLSAGLVTDLSLLIHPEVRGGDPAGFVRSGMLPPDFGGGPGLALSHLERLEGGVVWAIWEVERA
jgi:2,5-diamino-6-(ribosylamino)-4(3H)-pyrimidinone 5'-phosphate reductase